MTGEQTQPADRPSSGAGEAKVRNFADKVRMGVEVTRAKDLQLEIRALQEEAVRLAGRLEEVYGKIATLIHGLERERDATPANPGN